MSARYGGRSQPALGLVGQERGDHLGLGRKGFDATASTPPDEGVHIGLVRPPRGWTLALSGEISGCLAVPAQQCQGVGENFEGFLGDVHGGSLLATG